MSQPEAQDERSDLRRRAEALLEDPLPELEALSPVEARRLLEELRVHQIELELQNQALRQAQLERELLLEQYTDLYDSAPVGYFSLDENGLIRRANLTGAAMLGQDRERLVGQRFSHYVAPSNQDDYHFYLVRLFQHEDRERCQVRLVPLQVPPFYAHLEGQILRESLLQDRRCRMMVSDVSQQVRAQRALQQAQDELEEVRRRLAQSQEAEWLELAQRLHDEPVQELYGISFRLETVAQALQETEPAVELAAVQALLQQTTRSLQATSRRLRPPTLFSFGLAAAIHSDVERWQERFQVRLDLMDDGVDLPQPARLALFRIYQEGLDNAARHAGAERVWIRLWLDEERVTLEIRDDGRGFEPPERWVAWARQGRLGLLAARERAQALGGRLHIDSAPGEGTCLRAILPRSEKARLDASSEEVIG